MVENYKYIIHGGDQMKKIILILCLSMLLSFVSTNVPTTSSVAFAATSLSQVLAEGYTLKSTGGYPDKDIQTAEAITLANNNTTVATVMAAKTKFNTWKDVQKLFNVSNTAYAKALVKIKAAK